MGRDRRREACGPETAQPTRITVLGCRRWPCLQTVKSGPTRCVLKNRPDLPQKNGGKFFKTQNSQGKRPGGSDLASGGGVTEIIDCNQRSDLTWERSYILRRRFPKNRAVLYPHGGALLLSLPLEVGAYNWTWRVQTPCNPCEKTSRTHMSNC